MVKYFWDWVEDSQNYQEIGDYPEKLTEDELKAIAQEIMRDFWADDDAGECVYIGIGEPIKAADIAADAVPGYMPWELVERAMENAFNKGLYEGEDPLIEPNQEDIDDLDRRIEEAFTKWLEERNVVRAWYTIDNPKAYYREDTNEP